MGIDRVQKRRYLDILVRISFVIFRVSGGEIIQIFCIDLAMEGVCMLTATLRFIYTEDRSAEVSGNLQLCMLLNLQNRLSATGHKNW